MVDKQIVPAHRRRTVLTVATVTAILILSSIYAYYQSLPPQTGPRASIISDPLEFSIELDKSEYFDNENASVRMVVTNVSNLTVVLTWGGARFWGDKEAFFDYSIFDQNGTEVFRRFRGVGVEAVILSKTLSPGEQLPDEHVWTQTTGYPEFERFPKGTYSIRASTGEFFLKVGDQESFLTLETPSIIFSVV